MSVARPTSVWYGQCTSRATSPAAPKLGEYRKSVRLLWESAARDACSASGGSSSEVASSAAMPMAPQATPTASAATAAGGKAAAASAPPRSWKSSVAGGR